MTEAHVNFDAPAVLRKWPSLHNERRPEGTGPYLLVDGTLEEMHTGVHGQARARGPLVRNTYCAPSRR
jgi:hypothetical protein